MPGLGIDPDPLIALAFLLAAIAAFAGGRLPVVPVVVRRLMVTPMALVATGVFDDILGAGSGGVTAALGGVLRGDAPPEVTAFLPLILGAIAALYVMLVIAPRDRRPGRERARLDRAIPAVPGVAGPGQRRVRGLS